MEFLLCAASRLMRLEWSELVGIAHDKTANRRALACLAPDGAAATDGSEFAYGGTGHRFPVSLAGGQHVRSVALDEAHLESRRIISYDVSDQRAKSFDILRTQILQSMDKKKWQVLAVTSPTAGCGKTLTAINLALSIARQPERSALLVDMDLQKPQVARRLGIRCETGLLSVLEGHATLPEAMISAYAGRHQLMVLPAERATADSSEWMASRAMQGVISGDQAGLSLHHHLARHAADAARGRGHRRAAADRLRAVGHRGGHDHGGGGRGMQQVPTLGESGAGGGQQDS